MYCMTNSIRHHLHFVLPSHSLLPTLVKIFLFQTVFLSYFLKKVQECLNSLHPFLDKHFISSSSTLPLCASSCNSKIRVKRPTLNFLSWICSCLMDGKASWIINEKISRAYSWSIFLLIHNAAAVKTESGGLSPLPQKDISNVSSSASLQFLPLYWLTLSYQSPLTISISIVFCSDVLCNSLVPAHS